MTGNSFFAGRSVAVLHRTATQTVGVNAPAQLADAITWLTEQLADHWENGQYLTFHPAVDNTLGAYDPNIDVIMASIYGAVECTDARLLATAAKIHSQWTDDAGYRYPIKRERPSARPRPATRALPGGHI